jgi:hypothetical protein
MPGFSLTNAAKADLKSIGRYTQETWGIEQRNRYLTLLEKAFMIWRLIHSWGGTAATLGPVTANYQSESILCSTDKKNLS